MSKDNTPVNLTQTSENQNVITDPTNFNQKQFNPVPNANLNNGVGFTQPTQSNTLVKEGVVQSASDFVCPNCHFGLSRGATVCMHCGLDIKGVTKTQSKDSVVYNNVKNRKITPVIIGDAIIFTLFIAAFIYEGYFGKYNILKYIPFGTFAIIGSFAVSYFYLFCYHVLLHKARLAWWVSFIPIVNNFQSYTLMCNDAFFIFWNLIPIGLVTVFYFTGAVYLNLFALAIFLIINIEAEIKFAHRFNASAILLILFPYVYLPIMALSKKYGCEI